MEAELAGEEDVLTSNPKFMKKVKELVASYEDVFKTVDCPFGQTGLTECWLRMKPGTKPVKQSPRPLNSKDEADLRTHLDIWLEQGIIEPSSSPWSSPLVAVKNKDWSTRYAVDFRQVNNCLISDGYPLPRKPLTRCRESLSACRQPERYIHGLYSKC